MDNPLVAAARQLRDETAPLTFSGAVAFVYHPLEYAWEPHRLYLEKMGQPKKAVVFLGMNPGPWGMAQTGVPFGEVMAVREWLGIEAQVLPPSTLHPRRPVDGFACRRSEASGRRLWGLFRERYGSAAVFSRDHFVANWCPLLFFTTTGANLTPDKLKGRDSSQLLAACDRHLQRVCDILAPHWVIGVGSFAESCARRALSGRGIRIGRILHPSPASPAANRGWAEAVTSTLKSLGIWN